ncbi:MAG TPA: YbaB/EbfC family nucleoid-associated protein [Phycisphaerales bacterium]|nr:YbaB/EbfC family nucleoid-associated protein [Phycisphaerales bacterium]
MLDQMKMLGALSGILKNRDKLAGAGDRIKAKLSAVKVTGESTGGGVKAIVSGALVVQKIELSPQVVQQINAGGVTRDGATQLICEAINDAIAAAQVEIKKAVDEEAKVLGLEGGMPDMAGLGNLLG